MKQRTAIFEIFSTEDGRYAWTFKRGGRVVAQSPESYARRRAARRAIDNFAGAIMDGRYRIDDL